MTAEEIIEYAQHTLDGIKLANEGGDKYNAVAPLTRIFNSYSALYNKLTGKRLIVVDGVVQVEE